VRVVGGLEAVELSLHRRHVDDELWLPLRSFR
jgi:hypothetical protein